MTFPAPDHFDGKKFFNPPQFSFPDEPAPGNRRRFTILRWLFSLRFRWPDARPQRVHALPPPPAPGTVTVTFINHATFLLCIGRIAKPPLRILTDPVFSERCSPFRNFGPRRVTPPGIPLADLPPIDIVAISHCHYDHLDLPTLRFLARRDSPFCVTPLGNARFLRKAGMKRIVELDWWQNHMCGDDLTVTVTPARHNSARTPFDRNRALWGGFHFSTPAGTLYFSGDSAHGTHWQMIRDRLGSPDIAILPIGAYAPRPIMRRAHTDPEEGFAAYQTLAPRHAFGMHYGTFQLSEEGIDEPAARLRLATRAAGLPDETFECLENGESRTITEATICHDKKSG